MRLAAIAALALLVQSCGEKKPEIEPSHRGVYFAAGADVNSFTPCGEQSMYWVEGKASFGLQARYREITRRPFQPIYVELLAEVQSRSNQALREGHTGNIRVDSVLTARTVVPATCKLPAPEE